jgi:hypothetical protein
MFYKFKNNKAIKFPAWIFICFLFSINLNFAQDKNRISGNNVRVHILEDRNIIYYDLLGSEEDEYDVKIYLIFKLAKDSILLQSVSGNIGRGVKAGKDRAIIWRFNDELTLQNKNLESDVEFHISGLKIQSAKSISLFDNKTFYWIAGGALVIGGGITWLLLSKKKDTAPEFLPDPAGLGVPPR